MKTLLFCSIIILFFQITKAQDNTQKLRIASQISLHAYKYKYRLYDTQLLLGARYNDNYFLGGISVSNEVSITPELGYNNKIWPQNIGPAFEYLRKIKKSRIGIGYSRNKVLTAHNFSIITNNIEKEYSNKVFTEELFVSYAYNVLNNDNVSFGASFKLSFIKEYNYFKSITLNYEDASKKFNVVPSIGVDFGFH